MATLQQIRDNQPRKKLPDGRKGKQAILEVLEDTFQPQPTTRKPLRDIVNSGQNSESKQKCPRCNDFGWVPIDESHSQWAEWTGSIWQLNGYPAPLVECSECIKQRRAKYLALLQEISGLTPAHRLLTLDMIQTGERRPRTTAMVQMARAFLDNPYGFVTFCGPYGNGKSTTLMAIVNACVAQAIPAVYIKFSDLIGYARAAFKGDGESDWERVHRLAQVQVLCIDEMSPDQIKETEYVKMIQSLIIDARYTSGEAGMTGTVVAGNFSLFGENSDLPGVPDWIATRLKQGVVVWNDDQDFRPQLGERR